MSQLHYQPRFAHAGNEFNEAMNEHRKQTYPTGCGKDWHRYNFLSVQNPSPTKLQGRKKAQTGGQAASAGHTTRERKRSGVTDAHVLTGGAQSKGSEQMLSTLQWGTDAGWEREPAHNFHPTGTAVAL